MAATVLNVSCVSGKGNKVWQSKIPIYVFYKIRKRRGMHIIYSLTKKLIIMLENQKKIW